MQFILIGKLELSIQVYHKGRTGEIPENLLLQMIGRAGRPQYDDSGKVIILTRDEKTVRISYISFIRLFFVHIFRLLFID